MPGSDQRTPPDPAGIERLRQAVPIVTRDEIEAALRRKVMPPADATAPTTVRGPGRRLAPYIEVRADVQGGRPVIAGTRVTLGGPYAFWRAEDWAGMQAAYSLSHQELVAAASFEAGRAWEREQRAERKRRRLAKRWRQGQQAADGRVDDRG